MAVLWTAATKEEEDEEDEGWGRKVINTFFFYFLVGHRTSLSSKSRSIRRTRKRKRERERVSQSVEEVAASSQHSNHLSFINSQLMIMDIAIICIFPTSLTKANRTSSN